MAALDLDTLRQKYGVSRLVKRHILSPEDPACGKRCNLCHEDIVQGTLLPNEYALVARGIDAYAHLACMDYCTRRNIRTDGSVRIRRQDVIWAWKVVDYTPA